ncbi:Panacea domain-containing protein [Mycobacterium sp. C3-094]
MTTANDVAAYILQKRIAVESVRLQKLLYYAQAWHLVTMDAPLFEDQIKAFELGPVVHSVWSNYRGTITITRRQAVGNPDALTETEREVVDAVIEAYRRIQPFEMSALTHVEDPWVDAWNASGGDRVISHEAMRRYYAAEMVKSKNERTTPVLPRVIDARVTYVEDDEFREIAESLDEPDDAQGLLSALSRNWK